MSEKITEIVYKGVNNHTPYLTLQGDEVSIICASFLKKDTVMAIKKVLRSTVKVVSDFAGQIVGGFKHEKKLPAYLILHKQPYKTKVRNDLHMVSFISYQVDD